MSDIEQQYALARKGNDLAVAQTGRLWRVIDRLLRHIARLEGIDYDTARTKYLGSAK